MVILYYATILLAGINRGLFIVCIAWTMLIVSDSTASVGLVFVVIHLINIFLGPVVGTIVDRIERRALVILGQCLMVLSFSIPLVLKLSAVEISATHLLVMAAITGLGSLTMAGALDAILQHVVSTENRARTIAFAGAIRQLAMVLGAGLGGYVTHLFAPEWSFAFGAAIAIGVILLSVFLPSAIAGGAAPKRPSFWRGTLDGIRMMQGDKTIAMLAGVTALCFSTGQLTNVLLPGFIKFDLGAGSDLYGLADAAWSVGGVLAALLVAQVMSVRKSALFWPSFMTIMLGISTVLFSMTTSLIGIVTLHAAMGACFSAGKVLADGKVLEVCPNDYVGRVRSNQQSLISVFGVVMYLSPTLLGMSSSKSLYQLWGAVVAMIAIGTLFFSLKLSKTTPETTRA